MTDKSTELFEDVASINNSPLSEENKAFEAPWQLRSFGAVIALYNEGIFPWEEVQQRLIDEVNEADEEQMQKNPNEEFYEQWLAAFERLILEEEIIEPTELGERAKEFSAGERDASEFVKGEEHTHDH